MSTLLKNLLIALGITLLLFLGYYFVSKEVSTESASGGQDDFALELKIEKILADTQRIDSYKIDQNDNVLSQTNFASLVDRRVEVPDVDTGRENPFAPVQ